MSKKYKHLIFDMDGTLTRSRSPITKEMKDIFKTLQYDTVVISGAQLSQIDTQIEDLKIDYRLGQNGNQAYKGDQLLWEEKLDEEERKEIMDHIHHIENIRDWDVDNINDLIEDRKSQISYSCIGHHQDVSKKESFDKDGARRRKLIEENLIPLRHVDAKVAGTTSIDYFRKGAHKASNILKLIEREGWNRDDCLYFGDALYPGGNDEVVVGVIDVQRVRDEKETLQVLKEHYANS